MNSKLRLFFLSLTAIAIVYGLAGCNSGSSTGSSGGSISLSMGSYAVASYPDNSITTDTVTIARGAGNMNAVSLSVAGAPAGLTVGIVQPAFGTIGTLKFQSAVTIVPGVYTLTVTATGGANTVGATITATISAIDAITISPTSSSVIVVQDGTTGSTALAVTRSFGNTRSISVTTIGIPSGLTAQIVQPGTSSSGSVAFATTTTPALAGTYPITLTATDAVSTATTTVNVTVAIAATINNVTDTSQGISGHLQEFMSTGFQPSIYNNSFFTSFPSTTNLAALNPLHIRLQPVHATIPWIANSSPQASTDWDFTAMDVTVQKVLTVGDTSPEFQIAMAPPFLSDSNGHFVFTTGNLQLLASYAANLVRYYNGTGFDWGGKHFQSASSHHITWWAIYNEPNINNITASQYVQIYNALVPAMLAVDPTLKFTALELSGFSGEIQKIMPTLMLPSTAGGLSYPVSSISTHFYPSCNQTYTDAKILTYTAQFVADVTYIRTQLKTRSDLANTPVWVTENNVNADYPLTSGLSSCNAGQTFVNDIRGTSAFFAAWRPYIFSQLGKAGNQALYHFLYEGSSQYGEVNSGTAAKYLSYWVDYYLQRTFPWDGTSTGAAILRNTTTETTPSVEMLAVRNNDSSVSLLVSDYAVHNTADNNGAGDPRTVMIDISALGSFTSASQITLDSSTNLLTGPTATTLAVTPKLAVSLNGYGTALISLKP